MASKSAVITIKQEVAHTNTPPGRFTPDYKTVCTFYSGYLLPVTYARLSTGTTYIDDIREQLAEHFIRYVKGEALRGELFLLRTTRWTW